MTSDRITLICAILLISAVSVFSRWCAFKRVDSIALELSVVSFSVQLLNTLSKFQSSSLVGADIALCLGSAFVLASLSAFHHYGYTSLMKTIKRQIDEAKPIEAEVPDEEKADVSLRRKALDDTFPLARHAIFLSYSFFLEDKTKRYIRRGKMNARENYAKLINTLGKFGTNIQGSDLLLTDREQIVGFALFLLGGILSVVLVVLAL